MNPESTPLLAILFTDTLYFGVLMSLEKLGRYEITGMLGRGAMGIVYKARDPLIERMVAIKTISYAGLTSVEIEDFEQRFFREAKSAGRLNHPNIVTIYDVGHSDELAYIAMEYLSGCSLRTLLDSGVVLPYDRIVEIAAAIADGLGFAHANGVVHRDIKPANIMVLEDGAVKIADFGIAQLSGGALTMVGTALGSPKYMSPEQVLGNKADGRSDVFSLGAVVYEMLTGRAPFSGEDLNAILYQVLNSHPLPPSSHNPGIPKAFDRIVERALSKKSEERYQEAAKMAADLRSCPLVKLGHLPASEALSADGHVGDQTVLIKRHDSPEEASRAKGFRGKHYLVPVVALVMLAGFGGYFLSAKAPAPQASLPTASSLAEEVWQVQKGNETAAPPSATGDRAAAAEPPEKPLAGEKESGPRTQESKRQQRIADAKAASQQKERQKEPDVTRSADAPPRNWFSALRAELSVCSQKPLFSRVYCTERARWKHCPGHWGTVDECPKAEAKQR